LTTKVMLTGTAVVRNRMPGGVGGRGEPSRLLPGRRQNAPATWTGGNSKGNHRFIYPA